MSDPTLCEQVVVRKQYVYGETISSVVHWQASNTHTEHTDCVTETQRIHDTARAFIERHSSWIGDIRDVLVDMDIHAPEPTETTNQGAVRGVLSMRLTPCNRLENAVDEHSLIRIVFGTTPDTLELQNDVLFHTKNVHVAWTLMGAILARLDAFQALSVVPKSVFFTPQEWAVMNARLCQLKRLDIIVAPTLLQIHLCLDKPSQQLEWVLYLSPKSNVPVWRVFTRFVTPLRDTQNPYQMPNEKEGAPCFYMSLGEAWAAISYLFFVCRNAPIVATHLRYDDCLPSATESDCWLSAHRLAAAWDDYFDNFDARDEAGEI
jgi:hypothetical protein